MIPNSLATFIFALNSTIHFIFVYSANIERNQIIQQDSLVVDLIVKSNNNMFPTNIKFKTITN